MRPSVYLAGPDVFLPDPLGWAARKKAICARHGLLGVSPLDALREPEPDAWRDLADARRIALRNEAHLRACQGVIANLTPFRGPSADAGTVYEVGFARALGLPVFGYSTVAADFAARTLLHAAAPADAPADWRDADGMEVERFDLADNLMIACGIHASGGALLTRDVPAAARWSDLALFEECVALAARRFAGKAEESGAVR